MAESLTTCSNMEELALAVVGVFNMPLSMTIGILTDIYTKNPKNTKKAVEIYTMQNINVSDLP